MKDKNGSTIKIGDKVSFFARRPSQEWFTGTIVEIETIFSESTNTAVDVAYIVKDKSAFEKPEPWGANWQRHSEDIAIIPV
jgi:hypothetical protein